VRRLSWPSRKATGRKQTTPIGTLIAMACAGVPVTTPRRAAALFKANVAADRTENRTPSTQNLGHYSCDVEYGTGARRLLNEICRGSMQPRGLPSRFGLFGEESPQPLAHRIRAFRRPLAEALASAHAELALRDLVLDEFRRLGRAVQIGEQRVLD